MKRQQLRAALIIISLFLFPITIYYLSPYLIIDSSMQGIINGSFIVFGLMFLTSLFFGRAFCGWICPAAGLQEVCVPVNQKRIVKGNWIKYLIWVPWLAGIIVAVITAEGFWSIQPFYFTDHGISITEPHSYIIYYSFVGLITILAFTVGKRSFCHHLCWMAPFLIIGSKIHSLCKWPALHLKLTPEKCSHCNTCTKLCPMSLEVEQMAAKGKMENPECILCGSCADACPQKAIQYGFIKEPF